MPPPTRTYMPALYSDYNHSNTVQVSYLYPPHIFWGLEPWNHGANEICVQSTDCCPVTPTVTITTPCANCPTTCVIPTETLTITTGCAEPSTHHLHPLPPFTGRPFPPYSLHHPRLPFTRLHEVDGPEATADATQED